MAKTYTEEEVLETIRHHVLATSLRRVARSIGVSAGYLSDILRGNRAVSEKIATAFGFERRLVTTIVFHKRTL